MSDGIVEPYYQRQGKDLANLLFDKRFLNDELSREAIDWLEDYFGFVIQSAATSAAKAAVLTAKMSEKRS